MQLPDSLHEALLALRPIGRPRLVGGCVRDWLMGVPSKDFDVEVGGVDFPTLHQALAPLGATDVVGRSFGVIKVRTRDGREYDFSLPRRESKTGAGHRGFAVAPDPSLSDADAAARRDFTVNAIAWGRAAPGTLDDGAADAEAASAEHLADPFDGREDLRLRLVHTGLRHPVVDHGQHLTGLDSVARLHCPLDDAATDLNRQGALPRSLQHAIELETLRHVLQRDHTHRHLCHLGMCRPRQPG
jgi:tRNA nucleotidyltransferase (CCA-adding enzyme)